MLSVGLVGLPNAGKSSLFNLLTKRSVPAENFPFCTIDPHDGIVEVPDFRVHELAKLCSSQKEVYAAIEFRDIAGLVKNASQGEGLGSQFLSHIHEVDLILLVLRSFEDENIIHVENRVNPAEDEEILMLELTMHDQLRLEKMLPKVEKEARGDSSAKIKIQIIEEIMNELANLNPARNFVMDAGWDIELIKWRQGLNLLSDKPILKLGNIKYEGKNVQHNTDFELDIATEASLAEMTVEERIELGYTEKTGMDTLIQECYKKLGLETYLTCGEIESRAWTYNAGLFAPACAGKIHTDFEKKFIKAEVVSYEDFISCGNWSQAWQKGLVKTVGKDYVMKDGDVVEFKIGG